MPAAAEVRFATAADADLLARMLDDFNAEFGDPSPGPETLARRVSGFIADGTKTYLLTGPGPDGFAQVSFTPSVWADGPIGLIEELYVTPGRRGHGLGTALMEAIVALARRRDASGLDVITGEEDTAARALYEKFGFRNEIEGEENARALFYEVEL